MRKLPLIIVVFLCTMMAAMAQKKEPGKKSPSVNSPAKRYGSLLWEISGKGLKKPSYLFGTMHVSDKLAFHLGDSFYNAIRSVDVVALETNPEFWQDDFSGSVFFRQQGRANGRGDIASLATQTSERMSISTFAFDSYEEIIKASLAVEPSMINGMLYRTYGTRMDDFEEDTFLDMYIFQIGKKLGKRLTGVENFEESEKLVMEAYRDMMKDRNRKRKSFDYEGIVMNPKKLEDAYRRGDLDLLDSLEALNVFSDAFQEKFLYKRNEIQARSIDTILRNTSLFVGVGAAHLPGKRGVIEMLREMGYTVRPIKMDGRSSVQKESIDKIRTRPGFTLQTADDGFYKVSIPGPKFYRFTDWEVMDLVQYADMINGAYYAVNRVKTNSAFLGHSPEVVQKKIDSFLYENVPGKILRKVPIMRNGYKGWDITNRTRRGDYQRYNIYVTPFEVVIFKMSGNGEYVIKGEEAQQFFNSVKLKEYTLSGWVNYNPKYGGFTAQFPHEPSMLKGNDFYESGRMEFAAHDPRDGNSYLIVRKDFHNMTSMEADSFELKLMDESYGWSSYIDHQIDRRFIKVNGYPGIEAAFIHKDGSFSKVKYVIRGPLYYAVIVRYSKENAAVGKFLNSFKLTPYSYPEVKLRVDSVMGFTVKSPIYPIEKAMDKELRELQEMMTRGYDDDENDFEYNDSYYSFREIGNDTTGERLFVTISKTIPYSFQKDSSKFSEYDWAEEIDSNYIYKKRKAFTLENGTRVMDIVVTDTGSSRIWISRTFFRNGHYFYITTLTDTLGEQSSLLSNFFDSFSPADTLKGESIYIRKTARFFNDLLGNDSILAKKARTNLYAVKFDSLDALLIRKAIDSLHWGMRDYVSTKQLLISKLGRLKGQANTDYLKRLYTRVGDTAAFQHTILRALLSQRNKESFVAFRDMLVQNPPILDGESSNYRGHGAWTSRSVRRMMDSRQFTLTRHYDSQWIDLYDSLGLTKAVFPDILQLLNVDDYKETIMDLLQEMVDSSYLKAADYETYYSKLFVEGRQQLKKQAAEEGQQEIERALNMRRNTYDDEDDRPMNYGNASLDQYAVLLLPFWEKHPPVREFFAQLRKTKDSRLQYNTFMLLLRNNKPVADSLFQVFATSDEYRAELYDDLKKLKLLDKFPSQYKTQASYTRSVVYNLIAGEENVVDSLVFLAKLAATYENKTGFVYFYKYRARKDDNFWQVLSTGFQPLNEQDIDTESSDFTSTSHRKLTADKPEREQLQRILNELINTQHESAAEFYDARDKTMYKSYLSQVVKSRRYRD